ncbi:hypothetical protein GCM10025865_23670 [Paraoerskovia sediminicola]|uniref:Heparan-alpha-glucosaminide N-acetyltransferase catalytic domain-containing protein n=1 Tax=Paraoerskovia sediminicola TaxID=1138587 RepID=A0ABM8G4F5_9CELL|nr:hypothetical protein [Paraoerskovia sediminicola]BDZ43068.1 hypothetical protein GCM10025865_23670 [Paraoerskovia sediminicola]
MSTADRVLGGPGRLVGLDVARGLAVLGMFAAHVGVVEGARGAGWLTIADGRSSILFAVVAGISIALVTGGAAPRTASRCSRRGSGCSRGQRSCWLWPRR